MKFVTLLMLSAPLVALSLGSGVAQLVQDVQAEATPLLCSRS